MAQTPDIFLPAGTDPTVVAGYARQLPLLANALLDQNRAAYELLNANDGDLTVAMMRPLSRGTVTLRSADPFVPPVVDPRYGSNPIDFEVLQAAIAFNHRLVGTQSMAELDPNQMHPPANASDDDLLHYIRATAQTEYHVSGTAPMMPRELGGVVSPELLVYGTGNLRVVDASIFPMLPAAHLQAVVYGVAEKVSEAVMARDEPA